MLNERNWIAHSENKKGATHPLAAHLKESAELARSFCRDAVIGELVYITVLLHDAGKYTDNFQKYLNKTIAHGEPHACWGAKLINTLYGESETPTGEILARVILGHHSELKNSDGIANEIYVAEEESEEKTFLSIFNTLLNDLNLSIEKLQKLCPDLDGVTPLEWDMFSRYIFSCLTDADWLDTESHFDENKAIARAFHRLEYDRLIVATQEHIGLKNTKETHINKIRNTVLEYALSKATAPVGFFSLNLPTGYGKTLTSVLWALKHAKHHKLERLIIVLPFLSITDQSASILKKIYGEESVLEHHSNIADNKDDESDYDIKKLAAENWDYPIIVTTSVQFFESLFSNKHSKCRKLHNMANAAVIFDEVQTLPKELAEPTMEMLKDWQKRFNTTFLFSTATMPAFQKRAKINGIENITSLVNNPEELFLSSKRVEYHIIDEFKPIRLSKLAAISGEASGSVLVVFNTRKLARLFYKHIEKESWETFYFLTNDMYPKHRLDTIDKIKKDLADGKRIIVSSTQLIEAGVDLDFNNVFRQLAPLDSIIQSAGRCNREGKLICGNVFIFVPEDESYPGNDYRTYSKHTRDLLRYNLDDIFSISLFKRYYSEAVDFFTENKKITKMREKLNFKSVSDNYNLINNPTTPVFIVGKSKPLYDEIRELYDEIKGKPSLSRRDFRKLQLYSVQLFNKVISNTTEKKELKNGVTVWLGGYSAEFGIDAGDEHLNLTLY
jgi:CRISPR-associated endonuclease/helicase Cas3